MKKLIFLFICVIFACVFTSCEPEEDFGFPSKIKMSGEGETIVIKGSNDLPAHIIQFSLLDYDGHGTNSNHIDEDNDRIEVTTDWLTVKYDATEYKLDLIAQPNKTKKTRKLYLYLYSGYSRQEITIVQSKN